MEAKKGDILFYHETGLIAKRIQKITDSPFNHVEVCIAESVAIEVRPGNIGLIDLTFKEQDLKPGEYIILKRPKWKDLDAGILRALTILRNVKGYSLGNITCWWSNIERLKKIHDQRFESDEWIICSELLADTLVAGRLKKLLDFPNSFYSPMDVFNGFEYFNGEIKIIGV